MVLLAILTGIIAGLMAVSLKLSVHYLQKFLADRYTFHAFYLFFPMIGLALTAWVIHKFFKNDVEKGLAMVLKAIARRASYIGFRHNYMHFISSALTVGFGGSVGLEAPIVATGSSIGSTVGRVHFMLYRERSLLIACGSAAGISAVFNAPIAGVIFAIEILLTETIVSYFIPLIIASVTGVLCSTIILNEDVLFNFVLQENFDYTNVPFYMLLGIGGGFISVYYAYAYKKSERKLHHLKVHFLMRSLLAGFLLVGLYFLFPPLFGEGYDAIKNLANNHTEALTTNSFMLGRLPDNWEILVFTGLIMLTKPIAAGVTIGGGGYGGNFAPSLFTGAFWGYFFSKFINITGLIKLPESNFTLTGMAAILSGVMYCPLTAIFLIAEITNGYELIVPLMIASSLSFFIVKTYNPFSMDTRDLAKKGKIFTHQKENNILNALNLEELLDRDYTFINNDANLRDAKNLLLQSKKEKLIVIDDKAQYLGWISSKEVLAQQQEDKLEAAILKPQYYKGNKILVIAGTPITNIMKQFELYNSKPLPVIDAEQQFLGFISAETLLKKYRAVLKDQKDLYE